MPVVLAVVIPLCIALVVFLFLHRRHVRKLRAEDENDKHKSLDFGMGEVSSATNGKKGKKEKLPEMSAQDAQREIRKTRGQSLDMNTSNPYLLPPGLQASRESIHSLSRSLTGADSPYRPATVFYADGNDPYSQAMPPRDDSSSFTGSSRRGFPMHNNESSQNLLRNGQGMPRSMPPTQRSSADYNNAPFPRRAVPPSNDLVSPVEPRSPLIEMNSPVLPDSLAAPSGPPQKPSPPPEVFVGLQNNPYPDHEVPRASSPVTAPPVSPFDSHEDHLANTEPQLPQIQTDTSHLDFDTNFHVDPPSPKDEGQAQNGANDLLGNDYEQDFGYDVRRLTMGIRPLPPDDPSENPEQRANRIRSFYKEYFDESTPAPKFQQEDYYDDYAGDVAGFDAPIYDPETGRFITGVSPYAEPITRRAMTPPPRGPPRFRGNIPSSGSDSTFGSRGPRAFSSASGRIPPKHPKKKAPPPSPLAILPTPHMLRDDSIIPIDFAPPQSFNERLRGTSPRSPKGGLMPYAPSARPGKQLVSSFDDLAVIPSPHALRKSGTFTSLDFAPPGRFKGFDTASDAGSIRSNRSGVSQLQLQSIRAGAYRLSRVPKDQVGTRDDFSIALKPSWDMRK
ncbi:hypothetical protein UCRPC4_g00466 [Phaeomoniella chlamydospora]|uniref:Uncharacterized protein n=1 Tax=Phaeomoniella chlamydospora TaxID=158046 RepID=A0A0G2F2Y1_PHACM|nr:hypothetical protein UCRPC4_g00466 [Phaeomoniella chlamydospora]